MRALEGHTGVRGQGEGDSFWYIEQTETRGDIYTQVGIRNKNRVINRRSFKHRFETYGRIKGGSTMSA